MVAVVKNGKILIHGAVNPWRLSARLRKAGFESDVHETRPGKYYVAVAGTDRGIIETILVNE